MDQSLTLPIALKFLKIVGCDPREKGVFEIFKVFFFILWTMTTSFLLLSENAQQSDIYIFCDAMMLFVGYFQAVCKCAVLLRQRGNYEKLIVSLNQCWQINIFERHVGHIQSFHAFLYKLFRLYKNLLYGSLAVYIKAFIWPQRTSLLHCFAEIFATVLTALVVIGFDGLLFSLMSLAYSELDKIKFGFSNLSIDENEPGDEDITLRQIAKLVRHHNFVLNFIERINDIFGIVLMMQVGTSLLSLCVAIYFFITDGLQININSSLRLLGILAQIYMYCIGGELIAEQTESVASAAYNSNWHLKHQPQVTKALSLVILRSQKTCYISAAGIWNLNMNTFQSVLQTAYTLFTFIKAMELKK